MSWSSGKGDDEVITAKLAMHIFPLPTLISNVHWLYWRIDISVQKGGNIGSPNTFVSHNHFHLKIINTMHQKSGQYRQHPGMTNIAALVAMTLILAFFTEIIISRVVSMLMFIKPAR